MKKVQGMAVPSWATAEFTIGKTKKTFMEWTYYLCFEYQKMLAVGVPSQLRNGRLLHDWLLRLEEILKCDQEHQERSEMSAQCFPEKRIAIYSAVGYGVYLVYFPQTNGLFLAQRDSNWVNGHIEYKTCNGLSHIGCYCT